MQRVYMNQFLISQDRDEPDDQFVESIVNEIKSWIYEKTVKLHQEKPMDLTFNKPWKRDGISVFMKKMPTERAELYTFDFTHPDESDGTRIWRVYMRLSRWVNVVEFQIELFTGYSIKMVKQIPTDPKPPRIVRNLVEKFHCIAFGRPLSLSALQVSVQDVKEFVVNDILDSSRGLPIIVVTPDNEITIPLIQVDTLARDLVGTAIVAVMLDSSTTRAFSSLVGKGLGCFNGGVRIYWPRLQLTDYIYSHPLWIGAKIKIDPVRFERLIRKKIYDIYCSSITEGEILKRVQNEIIEETASKIAKTQDIDELRKLILEKDEIIRSKDAEIGDLKDQVCSLTVQWGEVYKSMSEVETPSQIEQPAKNIKEIKTAGELLDFSEGMMSNLAFTEKSRNSSRGFRTDHIEELNDVLSALNDLALEFYAKNRRLGTGLDKWFGRWAEEKNVKLPEYCTKDHQTTKTKYGEERTIFYRKKKIILQKHFTIGKGDSEGCTQVYWEFDDESKCIIIGYVGRHLPYVRGDG